MKLDLGSGPNPREGFEGVDIAPVTTHQFDLTSGRNWPWSDNLVEELSSAHFIEHIQADNVWYPDGSDEENGAWKDRLFFFFDEAYRIIIPGGIFTIEWPALKNVNAFRDPTHRRFLPLEFTYYLSKSSRETMRVSHYNVNCDWVVEEARVRFVQGWEQGPTKEAHQWWDVQDSYIVKLKAVKT